MQLAHSYLQAPINIVLVNGWFLLWNIWALFGKPNCFYLASFTSFVVPPICLSSRNILQAMKTTKSIRHFWSYNNEFQIICQDNSHIKIWLFVRSFVVKTSCLQLAYFKREFNWYRPKQKHTPEREQETEEIGTVLPQSIMTTIDDYAFSEIASS